MMKRATPFPEMLSLFLQMKAEPHEAETRAVIGVFCHLSLIIYSEQTC